MPKDSADKEIKMYLIAGLGNPGREYVGTRHNIGFEAADALCSKFDIKFNKEKFRAVFGSGTIAGEKVIVAKPQTYMNLSGESIIEVANFYKIKPDEILVIHDELELEPGIVSFKWSGGLGGHNGLRSTKQVLNTPDFWRLRFGIGRPQNDKMSVADWVLSKFSDEQQEILQNVFSQTNFLLVKVLLSKNPADYLQSWGKKKLVD